MLKKSISFILALLMLLSIIAVASITASADTFKSGDFEYETTGGDTAKVTAYNGSATKLTIPSNVKNYKITEIGMDTFFFKNTIESVTIPKTVTKIAAQAFFGCSKLKKISIPSSVNSVGSGAFTGTKWLNDKSNGVVYAAKVAYIYKGSMPSNLKIKKGTISIADGAFDEYSEIKTVSLPNTLKKIGREAFRKCPNLKSLIIPNSVQEIEYCAFDGCTSLKGVTIPKSVNIIGAGVFGFDEFYYRWIENNLYGYDEGKTKKTSGFTIKCYKNTEGHKYAKGYGFSFKLIKDKNPITVKAKAKTVKYKTVKKKTVKISAITVKNAEGKVTYKKASGSKKITVNSKTGKLTVKKGTKKNTYKIKVKVTAKGGDHYKKGSKTVTVKIKVK